MYDAKLHKKSDKAERLISLCRTFKTLLDKYCLYEIDFVIFGHKHVLDNLLCNAILCFPFVQ